MKEKYINDIEKYIPKNEQEVNDKKIILDMIDNIGDDILTRNVEYAHITSSSMVFNENFTKVLMVYHNIYDSWSWTGGHADGEKDLYEVSLREAKEETGLKHLQPIPESKDIISLEILPVFSHYKRGKFVSSHLHLNVTYGFIASEKEKLIVKEDENKGVMWIDIDKIDSYCSEKEMLPIYKKIINNVKESRH